MKDNKNENIQIRVTPAEKLAMKDYSKEKNIALSKVVRNAVLEKIAHNQ